MKRINFQTTWKDANRQILLPVKALRFEPWPVNSPFVILHFCQGQLTHLKTYTSNLYIPINEYVHARSISRQVILIPNLSYLIISFPLKKKESLWSYQAWVLVITLPSSHPNIKIGCRSTGSVIDPQDLCTVPIRTASNITLLDGPQKTMVMNENNWI